MKQFQRIMMLVMVCAVTFSCAANEAVQSAAKTASVEVTGGKLGKLYRTRDQAESAEQKEMIVKACVAGLYAIGDVKNAMKIKTDLNDRDFVSSFLAECDKCEGTGKVSQECYKCKGTGKCQNRKCNEGMVTSPGFDGQSTTRKCSTCGGTGACKNCRGSGEVSSTCAKCRASKMVVKKDKAMEICKALLKTLSISDKETGANDDAEVEVQEDDKSTAEKPLALERRLSNDERLTQIQRARADLISKYKSNIRHNDSVHGLSSNTQPKISLGGETYVRCMSIMKLADAAVENGDTICFYGFFPGMSRHDAQFLAAFYNLDGNDYCCIHVNGERAVYGITLGIKSLAKILKVMKRKGQTFQEIGQEVANAVGDMQVTTKTDYLGYQSQWAERTLINGTHLVFTSEGLRISGSDDVKLQNPVETVEAQGERIRASETIMFDLFNNMVDIDVRSSKMNPFTIGKFEVTQRQWVYLMGKNPSNHMSEQIGRYNSGERPVDNVSWNDCQDFFKELNSLPEVKESGLVFRLPTAKEWECACRARAIEAIGILEDGSSVTKRNIEETAWMEISHDSKSRPVGLKKPNAFGLYDMIGNVSEWTLTPNVDHEESYVYLGGDGGSRWNDKVSRVFWREYAGSSDKSSMRGFRICASLQDVIVERRKFSDSRAMDHVPPPNPKTSRRTRRK